MPLLRYFGSGKVVNETEVSFDRYGFATGSLTLQYPMTMAFTVGLGGSLGARHPSFGFLYVEKKRMRRAGGWISVTLEYVGIEGVRTDSVWDCDGALNSEPIETFKDFEKIAGTPESPKGGARFGPDGQFQGFSHLNLHNAAEPEAVKTMAGVQSFLQPSGTITERYMTSRPPKIDGIGKIAKLPAACPIGLINGGDYLKGTPKITARAKVFDVTLPYLLSGPRGWNKFLYGTGQGAATG